MQPMAKAQYNYSRISVGLNFGVTTPYTDIKKEGRFNSFSNKSNGVNLNADYYFSPFITAGLEYGSYGLQSPQDVHNRSYKNRLSTITARGAVQAAQFIDFSYSPVLGYLKNLYAGAGIGLISTSAKQSDPDPTFQDRNYDLATNTYISKFSNELYIPLDIGYNVQIFDGFDKTRFILNFGYQFNVSFSDNLDGFSDTPSIFINRSKDQFSFFHIGAKFLFGPEGIYYNPIRR